MSPTGLDRSALQVQRCSNCGLDASQRDELCPGCGYVVNPEANAVSLCRALATVAAAIYLPFLPVLARVSEIGAMPETMLLMVVWPVAWLAVAIGSQTGGSPSAIWLVPLLTLLIATISISVFFAKKNRAMLILTAVVLATCSSIQALFALALLPSMFA